VITIEDPDRVSAPRPEQPHQPARGSEPTRRRSVRRCAACCAQDPDVILIGEVRDLETLDNRAQGGRYGPSRFSTLHTTDATQTINRVLSFYPPHQRAEVRFSLASALAAVVSQRLCPAPTKRGVFRRARSSSHCRGAGQHPRHGKETLNIPDLIKEGTVQYGMQSFDQSLMQLYSKGSISYESALFYATSPAEFALRVQGVSGTSDTSWTGFEGGAKKK
jgi:twitching motility protein PilT